MEHKICCRCHISKRMYDYDTSSINYDGFQAVCRICKNSYMYIFSRGGPYDRRGILKKKRNNIQPRVGRYD